MIRGYRGGAGLAIADSTSSTAATITGGSFTISVPTGETYAVSVTTNPTAPAQVCNVSGSTGAGTAGTTTTPVLVVCPGQYLYVANPFDSNGTPPDGTIAAYAIAPSTGALTQLTAPEHTPQANPRAIAVDPTGAFLYVGNFGDGTVSTEPLSSAGIGTLNNGATPASTGTSTNGVLSLVADPSGFLYAGTVDTGSSPARPHSIVGYSFSAGVLGTPAFTATGDLPAGLALDPTGAFLYSTDEFSTDIASWSIGSGGALAALSPATSAPVASSDYVALATTGNFVYVVDEHNNTVSEYTSVAGVLTLAATTGNPYPTGGTMPQGIAIDPTGSYLYVSNNATSSVTGFMISPSDGSLSLIGTIASLATPASTTFTSSSITIDASGQFLYAGNGDDGSVTPFLIGAGGVLTYIPAGLVPTPQPTKLNSGGPSALAIF